MTHQPGVYMPLRALFLVLPLNDFDFLLYLDLSALTYD